MPKLKILEVIKDSEHVPELERITGSVDFSYNWNSKLLCEYFTTIRTVMHPEGAFLSVTYKGSFVFVAEVIKVKPLTTQDIEKSAFVSYMDTGYSPAETVQILKRMHGSSVDTFYLHLLKRLTSLDIHFTNYEK